MRSIDSHCHLVSDRLTDLTDTLVNEARAAEVIRILNVGCDWDSSHLAIAQAARHPEVFASVGIQPHDAHTYTPERAEDLVALGCQHPKVVAVGEIGLDGHYQLSPMEQQMACFDHFLRLATEARLPVLVHMRETFSAVLAAIQRHRGVTGVIHCFTGNVDEARAFLNEGFYISFSGIVTFKNPSEYLDVVRFVPANRILVETDAPYLAPKPQRGKMNRPAFVAHTAAAVAAMRDENPDDFGETVVRNSLALFPGMTQLS